MGYFYFERERDIPFYVRRRDPSHNEQERWQESERYHALVPFRLCGRRSESWGRHWLILMYMCEWARGVSCESRVESVHGKGSLSERCASRTVVV